MSRQRIAQSIEAQQALAQELLSRGGDELEALARQLVEIFHDGGRLLVFAGGQWGSLAELVASYFSFRLKLERPLLPALALGRDCAQALALAREDQTAQVFSRQLRTLGVDGDLVVAFSDTLADEDVLQALALARQQGGRTALLSCGREEELAGERPDFLLCFDTSEAAMGAEMFLLCGRLLCELVEAELFGI